jgi:hypothetical protein
LAQDGRAHCARAGPPARIETSWGVGGTDGQLFWGTVSACCHLQSPRKCRDCSLCFCPPKPLLNTAAASPAVHAGRDPRVDLSKGMVSTALTLRCHFPVALTLMPLKSPSKINGKERSAN